MGCLSVLLQLFGIALCIGYFAFDWVSSVFVPIFGVACFAVGRLARPRAHLGYHMAARRGDVIEMDYWLSKGVSIDSRGQNFTSALHLTAFKGHLEATRFLLERGADVNARCRFGSTPLVQANAEGHTSVVSLLKEWGGTE